MIFPSHSNMSRKKNRFNFGFFMNILDLFHFISQGVDLVGAKRVVVDHQFLKNILFFKSKTNAVINFCQKKSESVRVPIKLSRSFLYPLAGVHCNYRRSLYVSKHKTGSQLDVTYQILYNLNH